MLSQIRQSATARGIFNCALDGMALATQMPVGYVILLYHRVVCSVADTLIAPGLRVDVESFRSQMAILKEVGVPMELGEMVKRIAQGKAADRLYIAVTFDDGYADNVMLGEPILKEFDIPATVFVSTGFVDDRSLVPWWDRLHYLVENAIESINLGCIGIPQETVAPDCSRNRTYLYRKLTAYVKQHADSVVPQCCNSIESAFPSVSIPTRNEFLDWEDWLSVSSSGLLSIGAHTVTHPVLGRCMDHGKQEIKKGKVRLEEMLGRPIDLFAYPFGGRQDFSDESVLGVKGLGFLGAVTTKSGINQSNDDIFRLQRVVVYGNESRRRFVSRIKTANFVKWFT